MNRLPDLTGKTVLVVGSAQCVISAAHADYVIAASGGIKNAPTADMLVTIDNVMPPHAAGADVGFTGLRVSGVPSDDPAHVYVPFHYEHVQVGPSRTVHVRNNGVSAIRLAADRGAKRILLAGFDPAGYDAFNADFGYDGVTAAAIPALIAELAARGITVEFYSQPEPASVKRSKTWPMST